MTDLARPSPHKRFADREKSRRSHFIRLENKEKVLKFQDDSSGIQHCLNFTPQKWRPNVCTNCFFFEAEHTSTPQEEQERHEELKQQREKKLDVFEIVDILGSSYSGSVYYARRLGGEETKGDVDDAKREDFHSIINNINVMQEKTLCPYVVQYYGCFIKDNGAFMVTEYAQCSIADILRAYPDYQFTEMQIAVVCSSLIRGLAFLHKFGVTHKNLKSTNVLVKPSGSVKIADFGVSQNVTETREKMDMLEASPYWSAPELISSEHFNEKVDIWATGIIAIEMAEHSPPHFHLDSPLEALQHIACDAPPSLQHPEKWSADFKDFLKRCLVFEPSHRASARELLTHPFLRSAEANPKVFVDVLKSLPDLKTLQKSYVEKTCEVDYEMFKGNVLAVNPDDYTARLYPRDDPIIRWITYSANLARPAYGRGSSIMEHPQSAEEEKDEEAAEKRLKNHSHRGERKATLGRKDMLSGFKTAGHLAGKTEKSESESSTEVSSKVASWASATPNKRAMQEKAAAKSVAAQMMKAAESPTIASPPPPTSTPPPTPTVSQTPSTTSPTKDTWSSLRDKFNMAERPSLFNLFASREQGTGLPGSRVGRSGTMETNQASKEAKEGGSFFEAFKNPLGSLRDLRGAFNLFQPNGPNSQTAEAKPVKFFGVPLEDSMEICKLNDEKHICFTMIDYLSQNGPAMEVEGIFRINGDQIKVAELKKKIKEGEPVELPDYSIHVISGMLKMYFRELPDPLLTVASYERFLQAGRMHDDGKKVELLRDVIVQLPQPNQDMLKSLIFFLHKCASHASVSKMTAGNLARCFAPNLLSGGENESPTSMLSNSQTVNSVVESIIEKKSEIWTE
ncbi:serine/threonine-protein kinase 3 [Planoprotostelium fungivorum]|uniref:Serine/threonine-protein kinase 3 n=1 Tax=Planoprotostelium fungivorum TaxID=1890364 RepID=A0A2P6NWP4_9EUKA|nr:serine/threonine-protein kinase 3 [Planoprotostelium fungivorum]